MTMNLELTSKEQEIIEACCAWLDEEQIEDCVITASQAADEITEPQAAQERLVTILTDVLVRNRRSVG
jgi:hypothetical protein